jgi:hypothetical protein
VPERLCVLVWSRSCRRPINTLQEIRDGGPNQTPVEADRRAAAAIDPGQVDEWDAEKDDRPD